MVTAIFNRIGNLGVLLIASALLLGGLAGAAVVHHYDRLSANTAPVHQADKGKGAPKAKNHQPKPKHVNNGHHKGGPDNHSTQPD